MSNIIQPPGWNLPERIVTPEAVFQNRRHFLKQMGLAATGLLALPAIGGGQNQPPQTAPAAPARPAAKGYPYPRHPEFNPGWTLSQERVVNTYINFFEFSTQKDKVHLLTDKFVTAPWPIEIGGLVEKPMTVDAQELAAMMPLEERVYRFRCVEAWAMIVPWTGFPLSKLLEKVQPKSEAKFVKFVTVNRPHQMPGIARLRSYPWPYTEGLRLEEAMHPLTLVATGLYGKPLLKQNGAPIRLVVPWKYGYKSIKSIVKIELVDKQPATLWQTLSPHEYPFESNVNPAVPHPRWSQATERMIDSGDRVRTQPYNGYGDYVAKLY
jgi:methionine sulfoxide reductase catalytic subunit